MPRIVRGAIVTKRGQSGSTWAMVKLHGGWKARGGGVCGETAVAIGFGICIGGLAGEDVHGTIDRSSMGSSAVDSISLDHSIVRAPAWPWGAVAAAVSSCARASIWVRWTRLKSLTRTPARDTTSATVAATSRVGLDVDDDDGDDDDDVDADRPPAAAGAGGICSMMPVPGLVDLRTRGAGS